MRFPQQPLFLARAVYRKRRLRDGARMLPIFGFFLLILPMLWPNGAAGAWSGWVYVFVVWAGLILAAGLISRALIGPEDTANNNDAANNDAANKDAAGGDDAV
jgi:hypothetical protein